MVSATTGWRASSVSIVVLAIASIASGCMCSGICDSETRLTASIYLGTVRAGEENENGSLQCDPTATLDDKIKNLIIVALITDKVQLANVNLPRMLESSETPVNFDFMRFFNWSNKDKFVTRSNIVIAPVKPGIDSSGDRKPKNGVILYPDRDPNGMLYIQLILIKECQEKEDDANGDQDRECEPTDWMNELAWINTLNSTPIDGRSRLWPLWNDLSVQSGFTAAILSNVGSDNIVSWNTFSFFKDEENYNGFSNKDPKQQFPLPINGSLEVDSPTLCLEVTAWNRAPS